MTRQRSVWLAGAGLSTALMLSVTAIAQVRPAPPAQPRFALPDGPRVIDTAQHKVRVTVVARGIPHPFSLLLLPDGDMLVSERRSPACQPCTSDSTRGCSIWPRILSSARTG